MYRTASPPERIRREITLVHVTARQVILSVCLWLLGAVPLAYSAHWLVDALVLGEGLALVVPALIIPVVLLFIVVRLLRLGTLYLSNVRLERQGFLRRVGMDWADVTGRRFEKRRAQRGQRYVTVMIAQGRDGAELELGPSNARDADNVVAWAIDAASRGEVGAIDARVRRDGTIYSSFRLVLVQAVLALGVIGALAWFLTPDALRTSLRAQVDELDERPPAEQLARAPELLAHPGADRHSRCAVGGMVMRAHIALGDLPAAIAACTENQAAGCEGPAGGCEAHFTLLRVRDAVESRGPDTLAAHAEDLELLARCHTVECFSLRMQILRALGDETQAQSVGEECIAAYGHLSPDSEMLAPCRATRM